MLLSFAMFSQNFDLIRSIKNVYTMGGTTFCKLPFDIPLGNNKLSALVKSTVQSLEAPATRALLLPICLLSKMNYSSFSLLPLFTYRLQVQACTITITY